MYPAPSTARSALGVPSLPKQHNGVWAAKIGGENVAWWARNWGLDLFRPRPACRGGERGWRANPGLLHAKSDPTRLVRVGEGGWRRWLAAYNLIHHLDKRGGVHNW
jgi:hypothetical protein